MAEETQDGPLKIGEIFRSSYEIRALIGRGGHAWVYHACHRFIGRHVAIKILHRVGGVSKDMLRRGQAEAQIQHKLDHPNIVKVDDAGVTDDGLLYIIMELLRGRPIRDALQEYGHLEVEEVLRFGAQVTDAMQVAHDGGVIHRDLKPENVFLVAENKPKVLDFGIAKIVDKAAWTTEKDMVLGTVLYMSPEQLQARPLSARSDIYALGVIMYEALVGRHPVRMLIKAEPNLYALTRIVVNELPPSLDELDTGIPRYVADLVSTAIAKAAEHRFESMSAFGSAIRESLERYEAEARHGGRRLQARDLSRRVTTTSGVERVGTSSSQPAHELLPALASGEDTDPASQPTFFGAVSSGTLRDQAPTPIFGAPRAERSVSERVREASRPADAPAVKTVPLGSRSSRDATPGNAERLRQGEGASQGLHRPLTPSATPAVESTGERRRADVGPRAPLTLGRVLAVGGIVGVVGAGVFVYFSEAGSASSVASQDPTTPAPIVSRAEQPAAPNRAPSSVETAAALPTAPPAPTGSVPPRTVATAASKPSAQPSAPVSSARAAAKPKPVDKMEERLRRLETDLEKPKSPAPEGSAISREPFSL